MPDAPTVAAPTLPLGTVITCISGTTRWDILRELAADSSLMVSELARRTRWGTYVISKQLAILRKASIGLSKSPLNSLATKPIACLIRVVHLANECGSDESVRALFADEMTIRL